MEEKRVLAVRIFYESGCIPKAELLMSDRKIEKIKWDDPLERNSFTPYMNGYTLFYDERKKRSWEEWLM